MSVDLDGGSSTGHSTWEARSQRPFDVMSADGHLQTSASTSFAPSASGSPPLIRSSVDSPSRPGVSKYRDSIQLAVERQDAAMFTQTESAPTLVEPSFDESVLRSLCEIDCGTPLLLDRIKQSTTSCREASNFFKARAVIERDYGRDLMKLARTSVDQYSMSDGKAGSFVDAWHGIMKIHESIAENRLRFANRLNEMSEELLNLSKEVDKNRKQTKDIATRYERALQESEAATEKSKARFDTTAEELERLLLQKEGEAASTGMQVRSPGVGGSGGAAAGKRVLGKAMKGGGLLLKGKNPANIARQEDDVRARMSAASSAYSKLVTETQATRQEYFNFQYPRILRALKECVDEIDLGTQYHLTRYSFLFENTVLADGSHLAPPVLDEGPHNGLKSVAEAIDNRADFRVYMQNYVYAHGGQVRGPRRTGPAESGFLPPLPTHQDRHVPPPISASNSLSSMPPAMNQHMNNNGAAMLGTPGMSASPALASASGALPGGTFGVDLTEQMARDNVDVPPIVEKCCAAIEAHGLTSQGIYRVSGTRNKIERLRELLERDVDGVDLNANEWTSDINNVASVLKLWLRELPDPLMTSQLRPRFIEAAKHEDDRLRQIRLHEQVNDLPDANYATLRFFLGHLYKITQYTSHNSMTAYNLSIVFGPTLFGEVQMDGNGAMSGGAIMADTTLQNKAIETILDHYTDIFVDEVEGGE